MKLPRYRSYRDSGVEWIGRVPSHWTLQRIKASVASSKNGVWGGEPTGSEDDVPCVRVADFDRQRLVVGSVIPTIRNVDSSERNGRVLQAGDLLLEKSGGGEKQPVGQVVQYCQSTPAICSNFVSRVTLREGMVSRFWTYLHFAAYASRVNTRSIKQTSGIQNLDQEQYFNEVCAFPETAEQTAIAAFLDRETAKIDALIAEQERLLELLAEKRQAVISHAVTQGLNPDAPMKDSGVAWLGEVPTHWRVGKAGFYVSVLPGFAFSSSGFSEDATDVRLLRGINVGVGEIRWEEVVYWRREGMDGLDLYGLQSGDVVIGMDRPVISGGVRVAIVTPSDLPCLLLQRVAKIDPGEHMRGRFIARMLGSHAFGPHFLPETTGVSVPHISGEQIAAFVVPVPPIDEQDAICNYIDAALSEIDALMDEARKGIALLSERRSALIAAAVTGQIDVREAA